LIDASQDTSDDIINHALNISLDTVLNFDEDDDDIIFYGESDQLDSFSVSESSSVNSCEDEDDTTTIHECNVNDEPTTSLSEAFAWKRPEKNVQLCASYYL